MDDDKQDQILEAALDLFRSREFDDVTLKDISELAAVPLTEITDIYQDKTAILEEFVAQLADVYTRLIPDGKEQGRTVQATIQSAVRKIADSVAADKHFMRTVWTSGLFFKTEGPVYEGFGQMYTRWVHLFEDGQTYGELHPSRDPEQLAEMLFGMVYLIITNWLIGWWGKETVLAIRLSRAVEQFLNGARVR